MLRLGFIACLLALGAGCGSTPNPVINFDAGNNFPDIATGTDVAAVDTPTGVDIASGTDTAVATDGSATCGTSLGTCDPVTNSGCGNGMGCYVVSSGTGMTLTAMCLSAGTAGAGMTCTNTNDCLEGFGCLGSPGQCTKLCCGNDNTSCRDTSHGGQLGSLCAGSVTGTDFKYCINSNTCDPYATTGNGCPAATPICAVIAMDGTTNCNPETTGAGGDGHGCCDISDCLPGYLCIGTATTTCNPASPNATCRRVCNPTATGTDAGTSPCPSGQACGPVSDSPASYGVCVPPMM